MSWAESNSTTREHVRKSLSTVLKRHFDLRVIVSETGLPIVLTPPQDPRLIQLISRIANGAGCVYDDTSGEFRDANISITNCDS